MADAPDTVMQANANADTSLPAHVLVVDDNAMNRDVLSRRLQRNGHTVEAVEGGKQALACLETGKFDLVMLDIMMPDMDGYQVLAQLRQDAALAHLPVLMISAIGDSDSVVRCLALGADDYLTKPFDPLILRARVDAALVKKRLHDAEQRHTRSMERDLEIGRRIQAGFLPESLPQPPGWEIAGRFIPARQVAGDFYDTYEIPGKGIAVLVADICDKGVGAALYMALFRSLLRAGATGEHARGSDSASILKAAVSQTNDYIARVHERAHMFATVFFGILDPASGRLDYVNAGHESALIVGAGTLKQQLGPTAPAIGLMPDCKVEVASTVLDPGDLLFAYTDGVLDATDTGSSYGESRLIALLTQTHASADALLGTLGLALETYSAGADPFDDVTMLAVRRTG
jgi:serine phosphatase RsbU (regulator of sigma subunit)